MKEKITVLIADDNQEFSRTLATYLKNQEDMEVIGIAKDGLEAVNLVKYQNSYTLASKMISTLTEVYDRLILETGV